MTKKKVLCVDYICWYKMFQSRYLVHILFLYITFCIEYIILIFMFVITHINKIMRLICAKKINIHKVKIFLRMLCLHMKYNLLYEKRAHFLFTYRQINIFSQSFVYSVKIQNWIKNREKRLPIGHVTSKTIQQSVYNTKFC